MQEDSESGITRQEQKENVCRTQEDKDFQGPSTNPLEPHSSNNRPFYKQAHERRNLLGQNPGREQARGGDSAEKLQTKR